VKVLLALLLVLWSTSAWALTLTQTGVNVKVTYTEPTTMESSSGPIPLTDLGSTEIAVSEDGQVSQIVSVPATALTGGGAIVKDVVVSVAVGEEKTLTFSVVAIDINGNVSEEVDEVILIDRIRPSPVEP